MLLCIDSITWAAYCAPSQQVVKGCWPAAGPTHQTHLAAALKAITCNQVQPVGGGAGAGRGGHVWGEYNRQHFHQHGDEEVGVASATEISLLTWKSVYKDFQKNFSYGFYKSFFTVYYSLVLMFCVYVWSIMQPILTNQTESAKVDICGDDLEVWAEEERRRVVEEKCCPNFTYYHINKYRPLCSE